jgi:hypothetical protein
MFLRPGGGPVAPLPTLAPILLMAVTLLLMEDRRLMAELPPPRDSFIDVWWVKPITFLVNICSHTCRMIRWATFDLLIVHFCESSRLLSVVVTEISSCTSGRGRSLSAMIYSKTSLLLLSWSQSRGLLSLLIESFREGRLRHILWLLRDLRDLLSRTFSWLQAHPVLFYSRGRLQ